MKKIANKAICLLLTLVLLLGVMPLAGLGTLRAKAANAGETVIKAADIGIAGGEGVGIIFKKGKPVRKVPEAELLRAFEEELQELLRAE